MKILVDFHHSSVQESHRLLFEGRLGWEMYRPIGMAWWDEGQARPRANRMVSRPLLAVGLGENANAKQVEEGIYHLSAGLYGGVYKAMTWERAKETPFDVILSSIWRQYPRWEEVRKRYWPRAKHIFRIGNSWVDLPPEIRNLMSTTPRMPRWKCNYVQYHPEFSLDLWRPVEPESSRSILNLLHNQWSVSRVTDHTTPWINQLRPLLSGWQIHFHGEDNPDGPLGLNQIPIRMQQSAFGIHLKELGDGYGFNVHQMFACGLPLVVNLNWYTSGRFGYMSAAKLFTDGETVIDTSSRDASEVARLLKRAADDYPAWRQRVSTRFHRVVNFDIEFERIRRFLERLR
jgi:hypothetical protein